MTTQATGPSLRTCRFCGKGLPLSEFRWSSDGWLGRRCRDCRRELDSKHRRAHLETHLPVSGPSARGRGPGAVMTKPDDLRAALAALEFLSDRIYHQVFEDGSNGGDHIEAIRAALSQPAAPPSLGMEKVRLRQAAYDTLPEDADDDDYRQADLIVDAVLRVLRLSHPIPDSSVEEGARTE